jgi:hypothetical protein
MASNTLATLDAVLKQDYTATVREAVYKRKFPFLSRIQKTQGDGDPMKVPLILSNGGGVANDVASAQLSAKGIGTKAFLVSPGDMFGIIHLDDKALAAATQPTGSFINLKRKEIDARLQAMGSMTSAQIYGLGGGALGRRASVTSQTITLTSAADALNFWPGMQLVASDNSGATNTDALRGGTPATVVSVDRDLGTVTVDNVANINTFTNQDYLFARGAFAGNVTQTSVIKGLGAWLPLTAPTDTLWGIARTNYPELGGFRLASASGGVLDRIRKLSTHGFSTYEASPEHCFLHPKQWEVAAIALGNQNYRTVPVGATEGMAGYSKLTLAGLATGDLELIADASCPTDRAYLLDLETWAIHHLGDELLSFTEDDKGAIWIQQATAAGYELRAKQYANLVCEAPWRSGVVSLPALAA